MSQLFEIIKINQFSIIVVGKSYCGIGNYITELETELSNSNFKGNIVFDLLLSNGLNSTNRFMISKCEGNLIVEPHTISRDQVKIKYEKYLRNFYKKNISIINNGVLRKSEIEKIRTTLEVI